MVIMVLHSAEKQHEQGLLWPWSLPGVKSAEFPAYL